MRVTTMNASTLSVLRSLIISHGGPLRAVTAYGRSANTVNESDYEISAHDVRVSSVSDLGAPKRLNLPCPRECNIQGSWS